MKKKIIAIIPAFNEQETISKVVYNTKQFVDEVIVINDGSTDDTKEEAQKSGAIVFDNIVRRGLGFTAKRGYIEALNRDADIVVQLDADAQYDASEIPLLVRPILDNEADLVLGSRLEKLRYDMPFLKKIGNRAFSWILRILTGADVKDGQTGFRAIRKEALITALPSGKYTYTQEMIIKIAKEGWRIKSVSVNFYQRISGESRLISSPFSYAWHAGILILRTIRDYDPLKFFGIPGILFIIAGLCLGIAIIYKFAIAGIIGHTPAVILTSLLIISGLQLVFMALIADMIRK